MDHSCSPTTEQVYITKDVYIVRAKKTILPGDKITCDYLALNNDAPGMNMKNHGTFAFECHCGENNCKGSIVC